MPWARLDDGYFTHRKVLDLSMAAKLLDLAAIAYSARELTDGELKKRDIMIIAASVDVDEALKAVAELVHSGRWELFSGGVWRIHDYLKYNPSREQVLKERTAAAKRQATKRARGLGAIQHARKRHAVTSQEVTTYPDPEPGPGNEYVSDPDPVNTKPDDARAPRESSVSKTDRKNTRDVLVAGAPSGPYNRDLAIRIQRIGEELGDDNVASSITRAQRYQDAAGIDVGVMANAVKDALHRVEARLRDATRAPPGSPMAYFLAILETTTRERAVHA